MERVRLGMPLSLAEIEFDPPLEGPTADALSAVTYGQNSKLFLRLRSPAPPSARTTQLTWK